MTSVLKGNFKTKKDIEIGSHTISPLFAFWFPNGAVYVARVLWFQENRTFYGEKTVAHVMPAERSLDVDSAWDLEMVRALLARNDAIPRAGRDA